MNNTDAIERLERKITRYSEELSVDEKFTPLLFDNGDIDALNLAIKALRDADNTADVLYLCDHKRCGENHNCYECNHTSDIKHAVNFDLVEFPRSVFVERAETDEGGGAHD
jgi:hypothetical protein